MTYKVTEEGDTSTVFLDGEIDMDKENYLDNFNDYCKYSRLLELCLSTFTSR